MDRILRQWLRTLARVEANVLDYASKLSSYRTTAYTVIRPLSTAAVAEEE